MAKLFIPCYNRLADAPLELRGAAFENSLKPSYQNYIASCKRTTRSNHTFPIIYKKYLLLIKTGSTY